MSLELRKVDPQKVIEIEKTEGFFLSKVWRESAEQGYELYGVFRSSAKNPIALFSTFAYKKLGKSLLINPPMAPHCGLEILNLSENTVNRQSNVKRILRAIAGEFQNSKAYIDLALPYEVTDVQPFKELNFDIDVAYTFLLDLERSSEDELFSGMTSERRKNIRDAKSSELEIRPDPSPREVVNLISETLTEQGVADHKEPLLKLLNANSDSVFSIGVYDGDELKATTVIGMDARRAHYLAGGTEKSLAVAGPLSIWEGIKESKNRGAREFDFLGSSVPSIERYFRAFGGHLTPYFRFRRNNTLIDFLKSTKERFH